LGTGGGPSRPNAAQEDQSRQAGGPGQRDAFASALRDLGLFRRHWPAVVRTLIAGRYPPEQAHDLILSRPAGIKSVIAF
jgi:hypothetical protein